jgi:DNA-directed RNA polymerase subunit K/omega
MNKPILDSDDEKKNEDDVDQSDVEDEGDSIDEDVDVDVDVDEDVDVDDDEDEDEDKVEEEEDLEEEEEEDLDEDDDNLDDEFSNKPKLKLKPKTKTNHEEDIENQNDIDEFSENNYDAEEDSDEEDDNILQKFNNNLDSKFLEDIHIETKSINYDEVIALARVVRDITGKIIDPLHTTLPFLTKYEKARIIGARAEQLDRGGESFIPLDESIINGRTIALMEFEAKKIPFIIARPLPNGSIEYWHLSDLEIL